MDKDRIERLETAIVTLHEAALVLGSKERELALRVVRVASMLEAELQEAYPKETGEWGEE